VPEAAARVAALLSGGVALATEISPDQIAEIERRPGFEVTGGAIANHRVLNFDTLNGPLRDVRLRRALSLAIDRDLIARSFFADRVTVPQGHQWSAYGDLFIADWPKPAFDPGRARSLLREAGYGGSVIPYRTTNQYYTAEMATAQILREMWAAVGLNVELRVVENWTQVFARPVGGVFNGSINMVYPDLMGSLWPLYGPDGFIRRTTATWDNVEFAEIGARLSALMDRQARHAAHRRVLEIFTEVDPPGTVLHATPMFYGKRRDLRWQPYPVAQMDFGPFNPALSA
jgi:peptide/nickel transport system substrate-binding protein